jgi:hypothetical protein
MPSPLPLQFGGFLVFRLFGLAFAAIGPLHLFRPREMTAYAVRRRTGGVDGTIDPTATRLLVTRIVGALGTLLGLALAPGLVGP